MLPPIPFNRPGLAGAEFQYMREAVAAGHLSGDGAFTARCQDALSGIVGGGRCFLTTSCTHALELAALLLEVGPGDEVILPSFTFVSTANAFALRGATLVFADIRPDTLNLDERLLADLITPRTKVIVVVHYAGVGCEMDAICAAAAERGIAIVEDNAHGLFGAYRGRPLGSFGALATQSFHETKNVTCGEGGAIVVNDPQLVQRTEVLREKGTDRSRFFRGEVEKYTWIDVGSSYLPSELLSAFLYAQLECRDAIQARRSQVWDGYHTALAGWAETHGVRRPEWPAHCTHPAHLYYLLLPSPAARDGLLAHLKQAGIMGTFHYLPLHHSAMGRRYAERDAACPVTEDVSARLLRLPVFADLRDDEFDRVLAAVIAYTPR